MKKLFMALTLLFASLGIAKAQTNVQIGANIGTTMGVSFKYYMNSVEAFEGIAGYNIDHDGPSFKVMYEYHVALLDNLNMYMGGGLHLGAYHVDAHQDGDFAFGIVPTIGFEIPLSTAPVTFGFAYEPALNFTTHNSWDDVSFKVRFCF